MDESMNQEGFLALQSGEDVKYAPQLLINYSTKTFNSINK